MLGLARLTVWLSLFVVAHAGAESSPYAGQQSRDIKALSSEEVQALLGGLGAGLAKAAELNGYPGPLHVIENASALKLSAAQRQQTKALFASMQQKARALGKAIVDEETRLDRMFSDQSISDATLSSSLGRIGTLQAELRGVHLEAHLAQRKILTAEQTTTYMKLRGYGAGAKSHGDHSRRSH